MMNGVDKELICEGIVGDGCGGGRVFFVKDDTLIAYDPLTKGEMILLRGVKGAKRISKKACLITIECEEENTVFDLSKMSAD